MSHPRDRPHDWAFAADDALAASHFDDFSDLLVSSAAGDSALEGSGDYHHHRSHPQDNNPFADVVSPLSSSALYNGLPTTTPHDDDLPGFEDIFAPRPGRTVPSHTARSPGLAIDTPWSDQAPAYSEPSQRTPVLSVARTATPRSSGQAASPVIPSPGLPYRDDSVAAPGTDDATAASIMGRLSAVDLNARPTLATPASPNFDIPTANTWSDHPPAITRSPVQSPLPHPSSLPESAHFQGSADPLATSGGPSDARSPGAMAQTLPSEHDPRDGVDDAADSPGVSLPDGRRLLISVTDPHKIGDAMNAHVVYRVHTEADSPAFDRDEYTVRRRYRDFDWLYHQLTHTHPGLVVPPVPEKQSLGRFQDEFVESRRFGLEKFLRKIAAHPALHDDHSFKLFLTSEVFSAAARDRRVDSGRGFFGVFGEVMSSSFNKFHEPDEWFENRRAQLDALESQLRSLLKAVEGTIRQRKELATALGELATDMTALGEAEGNAGLARAFALFGQLQDNLRRLQERQAAFDVKTFESTTDEYIRTIGSAKLTLGARVRAYQTWQADAAELRRKTGSLERQRAQQRGSSGSGGGRTDKTTQLQNEVGALEIRTEDHRHAFEDISASIRSELERFDSEKVHDFKASAERYLASMVEHQRQVIQLWEDYLSIFANIDPPASPPPVAS
ncbi:Vacuolar protein sorting-associated protein vps5 [Tieghemiomyces parasiticus]|uniref:Vacuolar protein sorting-associated protein vps5 n=1 Tax=Tieghemiomyces parasiticus TaxID=78921 RepID=A0A9W8DXN1_9FUNG|nr:Vacuolar protein sorting-associated protein vps5 [Tieghemiomyces parasiticus]